MSLNIELLPFSQDNYIFIAEDTETKTVAAIDPGCAQTTINYLEKNNKKLDLILNTHHHHDHIGGNLELKAQYNCPIYGHSLDAHRIPGIDHRLSDGDDVNIGQSHFNVLSVDGHTQGHIAYFNSAEKILFCGDTLFSLGCGRLFDGSMEQLFQSLNKIKSLPPETTIYCAHEYTLSNGQFALFVDPENKDLQKFITTAKTQRQNNLPTVPSQLVDELKCNPFLRPQSPQIRQSLGLEKATDFEVFSALRTSKDRF